MQDSQIGESSQHVCPMTTQLRHRSINCLRYLSIWLVFTASNVSALEELYEIDPLPPMDGPGHRAIGWQWHFVDNKNNQGHMQKVSAGPNTATYQRTDGCHWTRPVQGFAPAINWSNCPSTGQADVVLSDGSIWPLVVGNKFVWTMSGKSNLLRQSWTSKRRCEVKPSMRIRTVLGEHDVHKVHCIERWGTRTWWLSPIVGTAIVYRQTTRQGTIIQEMTRIIP